MRDRDTLNELYDIVSEKCAELGFKLTPPALAYLRSQCGTGCDVFLRRRLAVCRMLIDLNVSVFSTPLDVLIAVALSHHLPVDRIPDDYDSTLSCMFASEPKIADILSYLQQGDRTDEEYYARLIKKRCALLIRLCERGVLVETLYEWPTPSARRIIRETREDFFPMCLYAKEHYREMIGPVNILMEKMRNLLAAYEALITRYDSQEVSLNGEILSLKEENAFLRAMIADIRRERENE